MKSLRYPTLYALLLLAALCLCLPACKKKAAGAGGAAAAAGGAGGGAPQGPPPVPVVVQPAVQRDYAQAIELLGDVRAKQRATLAAEVSGKVVKISHRVGENAPKGQALIQIDPASYSAQLASAQASLEQAQQQLAQANAGPRRETIAAQESAVAAAQARYDAAKDTLDRQQQLYAEGVISESALVAAQSGADAALAALKQEQQRLNELNAGTRTEEVKAAQARVDAAISSVTLAQLSLKRTTVAPPFDALVSQLMVEVGQFVGPGTPLAEVVSLKGGSTIDNEAWFNLPEAQARKVQPGGLVELRADALAKPGETPPVITGKVASVAPAADPVTRQFPVRVAVNDARLRPGMTVRGRILLGTPKATLMVPQDSTTQTSLGLAVYRMKPPAGEKELPSVEPVSLTIGENVDKYIVVLTGELKPGDLLVTRGKEQLYPTAHIIPTNLAAPGGGGGKGEGEKGEEAQSAESKKPAEPETKK